MSSQEVTEKTEHSNPLEDMKRIISKTKELANKLENNELEKVREVLDDSFQFCDQDDTEVELNFLVNSIVCAYYELYGKDIKVDSSRSFGFNGVVDSITCLHELGGLTKSQQEEVERVGSNLLANIRDVDIDQYLNSGHLEQDIEVMTSLLFPQVEEKSNLEEQIENNQAIQSSITRTITSIMSIYEQVMAGGFEIQPYFGVATLTRKMGTLKVNNKSKAVGYNSVSLKGLSDILSEYYPVEHSLERQFNMELILNSDRPVYFPFKIVEYLFGRVSTKNIESNDYEKFGGGSGWQNYAREYIEPNLKHFLNQGVRVVAEQNGFVSEGNLYLEDEYRDISVIKDSLKKMERSMVTMVIIPELEGSPPTYEDWASIKVRMVDTTNTMPTNQQLMGSVIQDLMDGLGNASGQDYTISPETVDDLSNYKIYEYQHTFDAKMANIRPLFAYQALDSLQAKGDTVDWSNIVLGKGGDGRTVTSKEGGRINFTDQLIHNIIAGSRSGKGVMTLNIVSTSISSGRPLFYIDRKPDMAALFADYVGLSGGTPNMFIVNGSAYSKSFDINGVLDYNAMSTKWQSKIPKWWNATSYEDIGDIVYYRGVLFTLGLLLLRHWSKSAKPELYQQLGGDGGIAIVYDEFTNWQKLFSVNQLNPRGDGGLFHSTRILSSGLITELREAEFVAEELQSKGGLNAKEKVALMKAEKRITELKVESRAYSSDLVANLERTMKQLEAAKNAGFKNGEERLSDVFVIGQDVEVGPLPDSLLFFPKNQSKSGGLSAKTDFQNTCVISTFLYGFSTDWFLGYNSSYPNYTLANRKDSPSYHKLTQEARNFAYYKGSRDAIRGAMQPSTVKSDVTFFKPYLILNNAKEPYPLSNNLEERKSQCTDPQYQYVGGVILNTGKEWDKIRKQNLDPNTQQLRQEIGFFDYLGQLSSGTSKGIEPKQSLLQSKTIADMIVKQMGYDGDYLDFLMDLRPEWNFSAQCLVDAFAEPEKFAKGEERMPMYLELFSSKSNDDIDDEGQEGGVMDEFEFEEETEDESSHKPDGANKDSNSEDVTPINTNSAKPNQPIDMGTDYYTGQNQQSLEEEYEEEDEEEPQFAPGMNDVPSQVNPSHQPQTRSELHGNVVNPNVNPNASIIPNATGVADPFNNPVPQSIESVRDIPTADLMDELAKRYPDLVEVLEKPYTEQPYGNPNEYEVMGQTRMARHMNTRMEVERMNQEARNEDEYYGNYFEFCERITKDVIDSFGGYDNIEVMVIKDGMLFINNVKYNKQIPNHQLAGLPLDKKQQISNANYAHVFNFAHLTRMKRLSCMSIDSKDFAFIKIRQDMKIRSEFDVITLFKAVPNLFYLSIAGHRYQRDTVEDDIAKRSSIFNSARKRQMISNNVEQWGSKSVNKSWDSTKNMYQRKGFGWKLGGTAMLGVTAVAGATMLGYKGMKEFKRGLKDLFSTK
ncbi:hypothetical protein [Bacillus toyonensis]|uniref:hypothetical protein n=1 Tax=Bacillus toyonensis TaxID=155322 RepID=UPI0020D27167|nr:hypothetical protein [Bacillus toyonensis]